MKRGAIAMQSLRREASKGYRYATAWFLCRFYYRFLKSHLQPRWPPKPEDLQRPISVVVPAVEKDADPLKECLTAANQMILHPVRSKFVVGPESQKLRELATDAGWEFILEDEFLPRPASELKCRGWVLQQFIKLQAALLVPTEHYLVLDSDTVFLRPQVFFRSGKSVLRYSDQYELLYNRSLELIFGHPRRFPVSFVTHHMLFNVSLVKDLLRLLETRFRLPWWEALLKEVDIGHPVSFSEFEMYGHFALSQPGWHKRSVLEYWRGLDRTTKDFPELNALRQSSSLGLNSVSFHWHTQ